VLLCLVMGMKSKKIVLVEPTVNLWNTAFSVGEHRFDPVQLGYLSSFLRQKGQDVTIIQQRQESDDQIVDYIASQNPALVGFSTMTFNFNKARAMAKKLKSRDSSVRTVFGGYHVTANAEVLDFPEIDFLVIGEGEASLNELSDCLTHGNISDLEKCDGIAYKIGGERIINARRSRVSDLDSLPFPERYELESCRLGAPMLPTPAEQRAFAQVTYSRGCYHSCSFCTSPIMWQGQVVYRSAKNMVDEIEFLIDEFGTNGLFFTDLTFNTDRKKVTDLCDELLRRGVNISWSAACRVTDDAELLKRMKEAGCNRIAY